jgi:hypothetical protein
LTPIGHYHHNANAQFGIIGRLRDKNNQQQQLQMTIDVTAVAVENKN